MVILQLYNKFDEIFDRDRIVISLLLYAYIARPLIRINLETYLLVTLLDTISRDRKTSANENLMNSH